MEEVACWVNRLLEECSGLIRCVSRHFDGGLGVVEEAFACISLTTSFHRYLPFQTERFNKESVGRIVTEYALPDVGCGSIEDKAKVNFWRI